MFKERLGYGGDSFSYSYLDYKFGWRWLLPANFEKQNVIMLGLSSQERAFWQSKGSQFDTDTDTDFGIAAIDGMLIDLDKVANVDFTALPATRWVAAWGNRAALKEIVHIFAGFQLVRCYAMLPHGHPRVVIPLSSPECTVSALRLHRPGRKITRFIMIVTAFLANFGINWPLRKKLLWIAIKQQGSYSSIALDSLMPNIEPAEDYALYLGTSEANRKTVALPLPLSDSPRIIKYADNPLACAALRNEASALERMRDTLLVQNVPVLIGIHDHSMKVMLVQSYRQRRYASLNTIQRAMQDFLSLLGTIDVTQTTLVNYVAGLNCCTSPEMLQLKNNLNLLPADTKIILHRSHGDLAPWNCAWTHQGLFVFDWETSTANRLALADAFYYVLAPLLLVHQMDNGITALRSIKKFITPLLLSLGLTSDEWKLYLALWLIGQKESPVLYCNLASELNKNWL